MLWVGDRLLGLVVGRLIVVEFDQFVIVGVVVWLVCYQVFYLFLSFFVGCGQVVGFGFVFQRNDFYVLFFECFEVGVMFGVE